MAVIMFILFVIWLFSCMRTGRHVRAKLKSSDPEQRAAGQAVAKFIFGCGLLAAIILAFLWLWPLVLLVGFVWLVAICFPPKKEEKKND